MLFKIESLSLQGTDKEIKTLGKGVIVSEGDLDQLLGKLVVSKVSDSRKGKFLTYMNKQGSKVTAYQY